MDESYYCSALNHGIAVSSINGSVAPCCNAVENQLTTNNLPLFKDVDNFNEVLKNRRQWSPNGITYKPVCGWCVATNPTSPPVPYEKPYVVYKHNELQYLGPLMLDNTCNLMCYICGTGNSSKWAAAKPILNDLPMFEYW